MKWMLATVSLVFLIGVLGWLYFTAEIFSQATLGRLTPGLGTNEVVAILGPPTKVWVHGEWIYEHPLKREVGIVYFDSFGRLKSAINN
jgi:hypothetical protein